MENIWLGRVLAQHFDIRFGFSMPIFNILVQLDSYPIFLSMRVAFWKQPRGKKICQQQGQQTHVKCRFPDCLTPKRKAIPFSQ